MVLDYQDVERLDNRLVSFLMNAENRHLLDVIPLWPNMQFNELRSGRSADIANVSITMGTLELVALQ